MMLLRRLGAFFLDILEVVVLAVAIFLLIYLWVMQPHKIKGDSMKPNFLNGEFLLTDKVSYRFNEPKRGDVVVFEAPVGEGEEFIKRIIGLPGEKVAIESGKVSINSKILDEAYLGDNVVTLGGAFLKEGDGKVIPEGSFFVLGDNRSHSSDSRTWGVVKLDKITGRAWLVYWPPKMAGLIPKVSYSFGGF